jgi:hypothetical protein
MARDVLKVRVVFFRGQEVWYCFAIENEGATFLRNVGKH